MLQREFQQEKKSLHESDCARNCPKRSLHFEGRRNDVVVHALQAIGNWWSVGRPF